MWSTSMATKFGLYFNVFTNLFFKVADFIWNHRKVTISTLSICMFFFYECIYPRFDSLFFTLVLIFYTWFGLVIVWLLLSILPCLIQIDPKDHRW